MKSCAKDIITGMIRVEHVKLVDCISLSDTTISRRIKDLLNYCGLELIKSLKNSRYGFFLQFDESTDVAGLPYLFFYDTLMEWWFKKICLFAKHYPAKQQVKKFFK